MSLLSWLQFFLIYWHYRSEPSICNAMSWLHTALRVPLRKHCLFSYWARKGQRHGFETYLFITTINSQKHQPVFSHCTNKASLAASQSYGYTSSCRVQWMHYNSLYHIALLPPNTKPRLPNTRPVHVNTLCTSVTCHSKNSSQVLCTAPQVHLTTCDIKM